MIVFIPARGGSKGIPGKNLAEVGGASLLARTIRTAQDCPWVDQAVVTTDDDAIAHEAAVHGAQVIERPGHLAEDGTTTEATLTHALSLVDVGPWFVFLQCTSPFLTAADLSRVITPVRDGEADVAFAASEFHGHIWHQDSEVVVGVNFDAFNGPTLPRQQRPRQWFETGAAYALTTAGFLTTGCRFYGRVLPVECDPLRAVDVDTPDDLALARAIAPLLDGSTQ